MRQTIQNILKRLTKIRKQLIKRPCAAAKEQESEWEEKPKKTPGRVMQKWLPKVLLVIFASTFCLAAFQIGKTSIQAGARDELYTDLTNIAVKPVTPNPVTPPETNNQETTENTEQVQYQEEILPSGLHIPAYSPIAVDFALLQEKNEDVMAWVYCPDTPVSYPVVRGTDNDYYLNRLLDGTVNKSGSIFTDYRNKVDFSDTHTLIYGHNMKDMSMFGSVNKYTKQAYYEQHPIWYINTPEQNYAVVLLAGHVTDPHAEIYAFKGTPEESAEIVQNAMRRSTFKTMATYKEGDRLVTFSTCHGSNSRFILVGVLREIG